MAIELRKTRFVCLSDTHNASPADGAFKLPKGDVLIHAGDLTKQGTFAELQKTLNWIEQADFEVKIVVAGNHDITLDPDFYAGHGPHFHSKYPQDSQACINLVKGYKSITFLNHESTDIRLAKEDGPQTSFKVFGSPYSPANGLWAFGYSPEDASKIWEHSIPLDTDVIVTHTPPKYHCDESKDRRAAGCETLREKLWRVRPHLAICGHVHEGRGAEIVLWDIEAPNTRYKEALIEYWTDPSINTKKQSLIDLSAKSSIPLENTGSWGDEEIPYVPTEVLAKDLDSTPSRRWRYKERPAFTLQTLDDGHRSSYYEGIHGHGGIPPSGRCDMEALAGRMGRKETCIINAAIMASSWPYKSNDQRRNNKPIVVDIDLPVLQKQGNLHEERNRQAESKSRGETEHSSLSGEDNSS